MTARTRPIKRIFIHTSDTPDAKDFGAADIDRWHREQGWERIGYHYVVRRNGAIEAGREETAIGSHARGHNLDSIGVCWVGRAAPTTEQYVTTVHLAACLTRKHGIGHMDVYGHREVNPQKSCPNLDMDQFRADVAARLLEMGSGSCGRTGAVCRCAFIGKEGRQK